MNQRRAAGSTGVAYIRWLLRARPADYMLALSVAGGSLPVVGKHLKPLGGVTAIGVWGARHASDFLSATAKDLLTPGINEVRRRDRASTQEVSVAALRGIVSPDDLAVEWPAPERTPPVCGALRHRRYVHRRRVLYGDDPAQLLDVWRRKDMPTKPAPVLIFVPGGAWVHGSRAIQGYAVLSRLAAQGWVCLSIDYRVAPHHRWPRHILDVKTAIAWARANVDKFGGDRNFIAVAGCSAGVVQRTIDRHPEVFRDASPIQRVTRNAPPFLVIHGSRDCVIPVEQARSFVERLRAVSRSQVGYLELPGAGHGFDLLDGARTGPTAHAIALFLNQVHRSRAQFAKEVI